MADYKDYDAIDARERRYAETKRLFGLSERMGGTLVCSYCDAVIATRSRKHLDFSHPDMSKNHG